MRQGIRCWKGLRRQPGTRERDCGLILGLCRRGSGGRGKNVSGQAYFLALARLAPACIALSGTRIVWKNKAGSGCHGGNSIARTSRTTGEHRAGWPSEIGGTGEGSKFSEPRTPNFESRLSCMSRVSRATVCGAGGIFQHPASIHLRYTTVTRSRKSMSSAVCRRIASRSSRAAACSKAVPIILIASNPYPPPSPFMR